jgi:hypothetical protein
MAAARRFRRGPTGFIDEILTVKLLPIRQEDDRAVCDAIPPQSLNAGAALARTVR